jgi:hypothetical protein
MNALAFEQNSFSQNGETKRTKIFSVAFHVGKAISKIVPARL